MFNYDKNQSQIITSYKLQNQLQSAEVLENMTHACVKHALSSGLHDQQQHDLQQSGERHWLANKMKK
ncbi:MAG: hypothetical protein OCU22_05170 [Canidatus Methanoxibalbensis ujae]|nr:hypothetical protein [Candidatus Methanoxibalbensis ujae]